MLSTINVCFYVKIVFQSFLECNNFPESLNVLGQILVTGDFWSVTSFLLAADSQLVASN